MRQTTRFQIKSSEHKGSAGDLRGGRSLVLKGGEGQEVKGGKRGCAGKRRQNAEDSPIRDGFRMSDPPCLRPRVGAWLGANLTSTAE